MIERLLKEFTTDEHNNLNSKIESARYILNRKFPLLMITLLFLTILLLFIIAYSSVGYIGVFCYVFLLLACIPIWMIIMVSSRYFEKRPFPKKHLGFLSGILKSGKYEVLKVKVDRCHKISENGNDYYLFDLKDKNLLLLCISCVRNDLKNFPSDEFIINPYYLFDVLDSELINNGKKIQILENTELAKRHILLFRTLRHCQFITIKNNT